MSTLVLDHTKDTLEESLGLTEKERDYARAAIVFHCLAVSLISKDLYDNPSEVPIQYKKKSYVLESALKNATSQKMYDYMLLEFMSRYTLTYQFIDEIYKNINTLDIEKMGKDKISKATTFQDFIKDTLMIIQIDGFMKTLELIRKSNYEFIRFHEELYSKKSTGSKELAEIDMMLNSILDKDED